MAAFIDKFRRVCVSPYLTWLLLVNCIIFLVLWIVVMVGNYLGLPGNFTMQWLCISSTPSVIVSHFWTTVTYMVIHYDFLHLLFNMLWLFWFGRIFVYVFDGQHLLAIYVGGGLLGSMLYLLVQQLFPQLSPTGSYLCGASASVLAIIAAAALSMPDLPLRLFLFGKVKLKWVAVGCILLTFAGIGGGNVGGQAAHLGGVSYGLLFALVIRGGHDPVEKIAPAAQKIRRKVTLTVTSLPRHTNVVRDGNAVAKAAEGRLSDANRLDSLLDKIRLSGYSSLTDSERKELNALSQRLQNESRKN